MLFATADKSESPLDSACAMGEKLMSSKELMDPAEEVDCSQNTCFWTEKVANKVFVLLRSRVCA